MPDINTPPSSLSTPTPTPSESLGKGRPRIAPYAPITSVSARTPSPIVPSTDPRAQQILQGLRRGAALDDPTTFTTVPLDTKDGRKVENVPQPRPLRVNRETVQEPEVRNSITSLPDLIRRATRLATALDRGRPTSRPELSMHPDREEKKDNRNGVSPTRRAPSIAEMLAHFPTPGTRDGTVSRSSGYPNRLMASSSQAMAKSSDPGDSLVKRRTPQRRYCGLPLWSFVVLAVLGLVLITSAIVLPIVLVVLPRQNRPTGILTLDDCRQQLECLNGGTNSFEGNICRCICTSGFTGDRCSTAPNDACITTDFTTNSVSFRATTVGSSIPRLLQQGTDAFNLPLSITAILSIFASRALSCSSQNALVTFNGRSMPSRSESSTTSRPARLRIRQAINRSSGTITSTAPSPTRSASTAGTNGLVIADATATTASDGAITTAAPPPFVGDENTLDFARVGVLYILQQSTLDNAVAAQQRLSVYFGTQRGGPNVNVGNGIGFDLRRHVIVFTNGTTIGGGNGTVTA